MRAEASLRDRPAAYGVIEKCLTENKAHEVSALGRVFGVRPVHTNARSWFDGAIGELEVGEILSRLGPEWTVLHSVPIGTGETDVDHIAIGPAGVFALNTKHHAGKRIWVSDGRIMVAGQKVDHLRNSRSERVKIKRMLELATRTSVPVESMLVFVGTESITFKQEPSDVTVVNSGRLLRYLRKQDPVLGPDQVRVITDAALEIRTWHPTAEVAYDDQQSVRFDDLRKASARARVLRILWAAVIGITAAALVAWLFPVIVRLAMGTLTAGA